MTAAALDLTPGARSRSASPAAHWSTGARTAGALAFVASGVLWVVADIIGFGRDGSAKDSWIAAHPTLAGTGAAADMLAVPFLFGATLVWLLLSLPRSRRLAIAGAVLLAFGLTGQSLINGVEFAQYAVATSGTADPAVFDKALGDGPGASVPGITFMLMFFAGAFLGIVIMMIAVWRSRSLPRAAVALIIVFQLVGLAEPPLPTTVIAAAGLIWMAVALMRSGGIAPGVAAEPS
jgi:hypothetical protein